MLDLYTCKLTNITTKQSTRIYTHANSHRQALRNFCTRYSYPPYIFEYVKNERTELVMEKD